MSRVPTTPTQAVPSASTTESSFLSPSTLGSLSPSDQATQLLRAAAQGDLPLLDALLAAAVAPARSAQQRTATALAALCGQALVLERLLSIGFDDPLQQDEQGKDAMSLALQGRHSDCVRLLLPFLPQRAREERTETPLMLAAKNGDWASLEVLLPVSDVLALSASADDALSLAAAKGRVRCVEILCARANGPTHAPGRLEKAIYRAAQRGHAAVLAVLLKQPRARQATQSTHPPYQATPLLEAVSNGHAHCVRLLLPFSGLVRRVPSTQEQVQKERQEKTQESLPKKGELRAPSATFARSAPHSLFASGASAETSFQPLPGASSSTTRSTIAQKSTPSPLTPMRVAIQLQNWSCADLLTDYSSEQDVLEAFQLAGVEGMPRWAAAQERKALALCLHSSEGLLLHSNAPSADALQPKPLRVEHSTERLELSGPLPPLLPRKGRL